MFTVCVKPRPIILQLKEQGFTSICYSAQKLYTQVLTHNTKSIINNGTCIFWALKWRSSLTKTAFLVISALSTCLSICFTPFLIITHLGHTRYWVLGSYPNVNTHEKKNYAHWWVSMISLTLWFQNRDYIIFYFTLAFMRP